MSRNLPYPYPSQRAVFNPLQSPSGSILAPWPIDPPNGSASTMSAKPWSSLSPQPVALKLTLGSSPMGRHNEFPSSLALHPEVAGSSPWRVPRLRRDAPKEPPCLPDIMARSFHFLPALEVGRWGDRERIRRGSNGAIESQRREEEGMSLKYHVP